MFHSEMKSLALAARLFQLPADSVQLAKQYSVGENPIDSVVLAARKIGLKAKSARIHPCELKSIHGPVIVVDHNKQFCLLVRERTLNGKREFLIQFPDNANAQILSEDELKSNFAKCVILLSKRNKLIDEKTQFGLSWFIPALVKYKKYLSDVVIASIFIQLLGLCTPIFFQVVIDKVLVHRGLTTLDVLAIGFFFVILFEVLLTGFRTYIFSHTTNRVDVELGSQLYQHLLKLPLGYFANSRVGQTVARVKELDTIREFITGTSLTVLLDILFSGIFITLMFFYSPLLTWIVLGSIPCFIILSIIVTPTLRKRLEEKFQRSAENQAFLVESITGAETIKSMAVEPSMRNQWDERLAEYVKTSFKSTNLNNIYSQVASFINKITSLLTLYFGALAVVTGDMTVGQFIAFNMLAQRVSGPIMRLVNVWQDFQQARISLNRLGDILNLPTEPGYNPNRASLPSLEGAVKFESVVFRYDPKESPVINSISFNVNAGDVIGVVGHSGSGKSTLTKLIQRLYVPEVGKVLIDNIDLSQVDPSWLRQNIGVVLQENFLFNRSIRDNIALAEGGASIERVVQSAKLAGAHEFISRLPNGYDTPVGEQGSSLSGGQKQRIAIARALLTKPKILIFDEATSALDYESESIIQNNMQQIAHGRTVFIIAHRLSAVRQSDKIFVIDKGQLVENGDHNSLIKYGGIYAHLFGIQSKRPVKLLKKQTSNINKGVVND